MDFDGKVALVTGGGRDIGRAISRRLASGGAAVILNYQNDKAAAQETAAMIRSEGGRALVCQADVTDSAEVLSLVETARAAFGGTIDVLVNCAGGLVGRRPLPDLNEAFFDTVMALNLKSAYLVTRAALPSIPDGGAVVNISSIAARDGGGPGAAAYAAAKGGLLTLTRAWAKELGPRNIRVNAVCPGLIDTTFHDLHTPPQARAGVAAATPLRREGRPEEVAEAVAFLASGRGSFVSGAALDVNGGLIFA